MSIYFSSQKGRRPTNEDGHTIKVFLNPENNKKHFAKVNMYAIYDGHGGSAVSKYLASNLDYNFVKKTVQYPLTKKYVIDVYNKVQADLTEKCKYYAKQCGSTCLCVLHFKDNNGRYKIHVLNTGDSRACMCNGNKAIRLTEDHKPGTIKERERIIKLGGKIVKDGTDYRIGNLSVSRSFGDNDTRPYITHLPDMFTHTITSKDRFLILACDGLWDVMSDQNAINFILINCYDKDGKRIKKKINIARQLANFAINVLNSTDNVSVIIVFFD
jgi:serine/threonine protein phosphatase PrpC